MLVINASLKNPHSFLLSYFFLMLSLECKGDSSALQYSNFHKMSVDSGRRSLEMYTKQSPNKNVLEPVKAQFDYSKLPVLTTQRPWDGRQAKKQKKYWQRRRRKRKHQTSLQKNKKPTNNMKNDQTKPELFKQQQVVSSNLPKNTSLDSNQVVAGNSNRRRLDNSEAIINQIAQHVSDTYSMKNALTKYKSISERRKSVDKVTASERASEAESYTRPIVVPRAVRGTPTTARPKSYSNAVTPHSHRYTFQTHPNSFSFFNLGPKGHSSYHQPTPQPTTYSYPSSSPTLPILFTSPAPAVQRPRYVPLSIGLPPLTPVTTAPVQNQFRQHQSTSTQFFQPTTATAQQPTRPTSRTPQSQDTTRSAGKKEEPTLSVISPSILADGDEEEVPLKKGRDSFASSEANFQKLALDDQQTLALNELLLQVTEMKKRTAKLELDNNFLRSQVRAKCMCPISLGWP